MSLDKIEHVVLLMLENRSFDSMLGGLYTRADPPMRYIPAADPADPFRGLDSFDKSRFTNTSRDGTISQQPGSPATGFSVPAVGPGEEFDRVAMQFFAVETPAAGAVPTMTGVLRDFVDTLAPGGTGPLPARKIPLAKSIMQTYFPYQLPVLNQLARHYAVCDDWFASVPSQTNPNRAFAMCGTSHGLANNGDLEESKQAKALEALAKIKIGDDRFPDKTIFNAMSEAGRSWNVFYSTSYLPEKISTILDMAEGGGGLAEEFAPALLPLLGALGESMAYLRGLTSGAYDSSYTWRLFPKIHDIEGAKDRFRKVDDFHAMARAGTLPAFSYIEPWWTIESAADCDSIKAVMTDSGNDYHPPGNTLVAEEFVKDIYESLISHPGQWSKTLLILTFDEQVGSFDHAIPPAATPPLGPDGKPVVNAATGFQFDRFGGRVPAILVSPYVEKGTVFRSPGEAPYDHTSILSTLLTWIGAGGKVAEFGTRTQKAPKFDNVLTRANARSDARDMGFTSPPRRLGDVLQPGDRFHLRNQNGQFLSKAVLTGKHTAISMLPAKYLALCADLGLAAHFPVLGNRIGDAATLSFRDIGKGADSDLGHLSWLGLVSHEQGLGAKLFLGSWGDSADVYYREEYLDDETSRQRQTWQPRPTAAVEQTLTYGSTIKLANKIDGRQLARNPALFEGRWLRVEAEGDDWTLVPIA